jgi:hypothetical protein
MNEVTVTLYSKPGCHLCEPVAETIAEASKVAAFRLVRRNILDDPQDYERYKHAIPVVTVNGREVARYRLRLRDLVAAVVEASGGESGRAPG